jgi:hypothetical protein
MSLGADLGSYLNDPDPTIRSKAHQAFAAACADTRRLMPGLDDPSLDVRRAAAAAIAASNDAHVIVHEVLTQGSVSATEAILRAVVPIEELDEGYVEWATNEANRAAFLESCRSAVLSIGSETAVYLGRVLEMRREVLLRWVLMALTTPATSSVMTTVETGIRSDDAEVKAQAIEAVESIGASKVIRVLIPLLEDEPGSNSPDPDRALANLSEDFDPWIRSLARRCLEQRATTGGGPDESPRPVPGLVTMADEKIDTLDEVGRILALQRVPMFSDLDPEDLALIAGVSSEAWFEPGEIIYTEGDEGEELLVIVDGEVVVTKRENIGRRHIATYGSGDHVGEMSLLRGAPRAADVHAAGSGLHALVLGKVDLTSILEHRPAVATKMLATLAERLAEQTSGPSEARAAGR